MRFVRTTIFCLLLSNFAWPSFATEPVTALEDIYGDQIPLFADSGEVATVLCFLGTECPLARLYAPRLQQLAKEFPDIRFIGINSNRQDSLDDVRTYVGEHSLSFSFVKDFDNVVADQFEATRTPEVVVVDPLGEIRYRGRIDDQYRPGIAKPSTGREDLRVALQELTDGKPVTVKETEPVGCLIGKTPQTSTTTELTYSQEISRILQQHCVDCHREGDIGPFALTDYEEVVGWGEMLLEVIDDGRMPPWHADPKHGNFANAREMPKEDVETLREWVDGGMPHGDPSNLPEPLPVVDGWRLDGPPDAVYAMSTDSYNVPADGVVDYQYFVVNPGFEEDMWVSSAQVRPGDRSVVHHCIVFIRPPDGSEFRGTGFLSAYVPGQRATSFPSGYARKIPAGSSLVFQMHYTPNGAPAADLTEIGLQFISEEDVTHEVSTVIAINRDFEIPPRASDYSVTGSTNRIPDEGALLAITPHMHYRGKAFQAVAEGQDGKEILLDVPRYDFNWQHVYELTEAMPLDDIDRIRFTCEFDNSGDNPANPDPSIHVTWGDQTWEEMAVAFFEVAQPRGSKTVATNKQNERSSDRGQAANHKAVEFTDKFFERFDLNRDGIIIPDEMPLAQKRFGFRKFDRNGDEQLQRTEVERVYARDGKL